MASQRDVDLISSYLDGQLALDEQAALEARLAREPELRQALEETRWTVKALRALPPIRVPRNFTLTRAQAGVPVRPPRRLFPVLRLATALASLAFVVTLAGDLLGAGVPAAAPSMSTGAQEQIVATAAPAVGVEAPVEKSAPEPTAAAMLAAAPPATEEPPTQETAVVAELFSATAPGEEPRAAAGGAAESQNPPPLGKASDAMTETESPAVDATVAAPAATAEVEPSLAPRAVFTPTLQPTQSPTQAPVATVAEAAAAAPASSMLRHLLPAALAVLAAALALGAWLGRSR
jgi:hypothetical protein